jgi:hypothetical protein
MRILEIAFQSFFDDTKQLVADGVRKDIALCLSRAQSPDEKRAITIRGRERERNLKRWLLLDRPLAYGQNDPDQAYQTLVQAVVSDENRISHGLPNLDEHAMTPSNFVKLLLEMSRPNSPSPPQAPAVFNGSFIHVLKLAHQNLIILSKVEDEEAENDFVSGVFRYAVKHLKVCFFPSHRPWTNSQVAPNKKAVHDSWGHLGIRDPEAPRICPQPSTRPSSSQRAADTALDSALAKDCNAEWFLRSLSLENLHSILQKTNLPSDFGNPSRAQAAYVNDTYKWVKEVYDGTKRIHHLALLVSIIASQLLPYLFMPKEIDISAFEGATTKKKVRELYGNIEWVGKKKKGQKQKPIFVAMFTTFIIALYEPSSPLRRHMQSSRRHGLGDGWTTKHSKLISCFPPHTFTLLNTFYLAVKGVSYTTLIRLGIAWGKGTGAYDKGTFGIQWGCHLPRYIDHLYKTLLAKLKESENGNPFGPFDSLSVLIGDKNARLFCQRHIGVSSRPPPSNNHTTALEDEEIGSPDMDVDKDEVSVI